MRNIASIISSHNKSVLRPIIQDHDYNCRQKNDCPVQNKCLIPNIVYEATVTNNVDKYSIRSYSYEQRRYCGKDIFWIM